MFPKNAPKIRFLRSYGGATGLFLLASKFRENRFFEKKIGKSCFRMFSGVFYRFGRFFEHGKPLGMIGDDFGRFDFRRFSLIFVGFRRVSVGFRGGS